MHSAGSAEGIVRVARTDRNSELAGNLFSSYIRIRDMAVNNHNTRTTDPNNISFVIVSIEIPSRYTSRAYN